MTTNSLAKHYNISGVTGTHWRRIDGIKFRDQLRRRKHPAIGEHMRGNLWQG